MDGMELDSNQRQVLTREIAADTKGYVGYYGGSNRTAFTEGWDTHAEYVRQQLPQAAERAFVSCWICHGEHELGVKFCSVLSRVA